MLEALQATVKDKGGRNKSIRELRSPRSERAWTLDNAPTAAGVEVEVELPLGPAAGGAREGRRRARRREAGVEASRRWAVLSSLVMLMGFWRCIKASTSSVFTTRGSTEAEDGTEGESLGVIFHIFLQFIPHLSISEWILLNLYDLT